MSLNFFLLPTQLKLHRHLSSGMKNLSSQQDYSEVIPLGWHLSALASTVCYTQVESETYLFYLDDGTLGGGVDGLKHDLVIANKA